VDSPAVRGSLLVIVDSPVLFVIPCLLLWILLLFVVPCLLLWILLPFVIPCCYCGFSCRDLLDSSPVVLNGFSCCYLLVPAVWS
jgi:hypothetical protein